MNAVLSWLSRPFRRETPPPDINDEGLEFLDGNSFSALCLPPHEPGCLVLEVVDASDLAQLRHAHPDLSVAEILRACLHVQAAAERGAYSVSIRVDP